MSSRRLRACRSNASGSDEIRARWIGAQVREHPHRAVRRIRNRRAPHFGVRVKQRVHPAPRRIARGVHQREPRVVTRRRIVERRDECANARHTPRATQRRERDAPHRGIRIHAPPEHDAEPRCAARERPLRERHDIVGARRSVDEATADREIVDGWLATHDPARVSENR
jgi:hypothetical protein